MSASALFGVCVTFLISGFEMINLSILEMIFILLCIYVFSLWKPINIKYFNHSPNACNEETSSGAQRGFINIDK